MKHNNANTISDAFEDIYESNIEDYENAEDFRFDLMKYGCISGIVSGLIYFYETSELFDEFEDECNDWLDELGLKPWEIFPNWEIYINSACNKNIVIWAMFEEYVANL